MLDEAGQILANPSNWTQGRFTDGKAYCMIGALHEVSSRHLEESCPHQAAVEALQAQGRVLYPTFVQTCGESDFFHVAAWNDAENRQHSEVIELFEKARAYAAEKNL